MISTPEGFSENIIMSSGPSVSIKQPKYIKSLCQFATTLDFKPKTAVHRLCADKSKHKAIIAGKHLWSKIPKRKGRTKIYDRAKSALYHWIIFHPQIFQSLIDNYCLNITIDGQTTP